ncbi:MAG: PAS domain-containing protein [Dehalococcoidales bacterium]|nr:PAS domain-containing protein [Dehalococcoidales bacterium]
MLEVFSTEVLEAIVDALPLEMSFIDAADAVRYYSKGDKRIFKRTPAVIGRKVQQCHPKKSLDKVEQVLSDLKSGKRDAAAFWIDLHGRKLYIRYFPVRDKAGKYLGTLEVTQDITDIQKITGEKRLLD